MIFLHKLSCTCSVLYSSQLRTIQRTLLLVSCKGNTLPCVKLSNFAFGEWACVLFALVLVSPFIPVFTTVSCYETEGSVINFVKYFLDWLTKLTPWSRVLPEKLTDPQRLKKFPAFYGTLRFITIFTRTHHLSLSWDRSIQFMTLQSRRSILILSSHLRLGLPSHLDWLIKLT